MIVLRAMQLLLRFLVLVRPPGPGSPPRPPRRSPPGRDALSEYFGRSGEKADVEEDQQSIELRIISSLSDRAAPVPIVTLAAITNVPLLTLGITLRELENAGLIEINGPPGKEVADLVRDHD